MMQDTKNDIILFLTLSGLLITIFYGYATGDLQKIFRYKTPAEKAAAQQRAMDHMFGSDKVFDASADNISTFAENKQDDISWAILSHAKINEEGALNVIFTQDIEKLNGQNVTITGYMFPLQASGDQSHFLLSAYPPSCPYCLPGGPTELIEISDSDALKFTYSAITLRGKFHLLSGDDIKQGMLYRLTGVKLL